MTIIGHSISINPPKIPATKNRTIDENEASHILGLLQKIELLPDDIKLLLRFSYRQIQYARKLGRIVPGHYTHKHYARYTYREVVLWRIVRFLEDLGYSPQTIFGEATSDKNLNPAPGLLVEIDAVLKSRRGKLARFVLWLRPDITRKDPEYMITKSGTAFDLKHRGQWKSLSFYKVQLKVLRFMKKRAPHIFKSVA